MLRKYVYPAGRLEFLEIGRPAPVVLPERVDPATQDRPRPLDLLVQHRRVLHMACRIDEEAAAQRVLRQRRNQAGRGQIGDGLGGAPRSAA